MHAEASAVLTRDLTVDGADGSVGATLWSPPTAGDRPLLLLGHGGGGGREQPRFHELGARFAEALGADVLAIDAPAHGQRAPVGTVEERFYAERKVLNDPDMPARFAEDWRHAIAAARAEPGVGAGPLLYCGFSLGVLLGVPTVAALGGVAASVFGVGGVPRPGGLGDLFRHHGLGEEAARAVDEIDDTEQRGRVVLEAARAITTGEVLMVNVTEDEVFPPAYAFQLFDEFVVPKRICFWPGRHTELPREAFSLAIAFFRRILAGTPADARLGGAW